MALSGEGRESDGKIGKGVTGSKKLEKFLEGCT